MEALMKISDFLWKYFPIIGLIMAHLVIWPRVIFGETALNFIRHHWTLYTTVATIGVTILVISLIRMFIRGTP